MKSHLNVSIKERNTAIQERNQLAQDLLTEQERSEKYVLQLRKQVLYKHGKQVGQDSDGTKKKSTIKCRLHSYTYIAFNNIL